MFAKVSQSWHVGLVYSQHTPHGPSQDVTHRVVQVTHCNVHARGGFVSFDIMDKHHLQSILESDESIISLVSLRPCNSFVIEVIWGYLLVTRAWGPMGLSSVRCRHERRSANRGESRVTEENRGMGEP